MSPPDPAPRIRTITREGHMSESIDGEQRLPGGDADSPRAPRFRCSRCGFESRRQRKADEHILEDNECAARHYVVVGSALSAPRSGAASTR